MRKVAGVGAGLVLVAGLAGLNAQAGQEGAKEGSSALAAPEPRSGQDLIVRGAQEAEESPSPTTEPPVTTTTEPEPEPASVTTPPTVPVTVPTTPPPTFPRPTTTITYSPSSELASIRACESGGDYSANTGNGYYGGYQFDLSTWQAAGGSGYPHLASPAEQDMRAQMWINAGYRGAWPNC